MDAQTGGFITCVLVGLLVGACGVYMLVTGNARIMHSYHYAATPPAKMPSLARWSGAGMLVCGIGCALLVPATGMPEWLSIVGIALLVAGLVLTFGAIMHFNGSLFSFAGAGGDSRESEGSSRTLVMGLGVVVAVICCAVTVVPGVLMIASGDPSALHSYHLVNVAPENYAALARWEGAGMTVMGAGLAASIVGALLGSRRRPAPRWTKVLMVAGAVAFGCGLVSMLAAIIHFNGSLMG